MVSWGCDHGKDKVRQDFAELVHGVVDGMWGCGCVYTCQFEAGHADLKGDIQNGAEHPDFVGHGGQGDFEVWWGLVLDGVPWDQLHKALLHFHEGFCPECCSSLGEASGWLNSTLYCGF